MYSLIHSLVTWWKDNLKPKLDINRIRDSEEDGIASNILKLVPLSNTEDLHNEHRFKMCKTKKECSIHESKHVSHLL